MEVTRVDLHYGVVITIFLSFWTESVDERAAHISTWLLIIERHNIRPLML